MVSTDILSVLLVIFCMGLVLKAGDRLMAWFVAGLLVGFCLSVQECQSYLGAQLMRIYSLVDCY